MAEDLGQDFSPPAQGCLALDGSLWGACLLDGGAFLASRPQMPGAPPPFWTIKRLFQALPAVPSGAKPPLWFQSTVASYCKVT